jgi:hypothetical protein
MPVARQVAELACRHFFALARALVLLACEFFALVARGPRRRGAQEQLTTREDGEAAQCDGRQMLDAAQAPGVWRRRSGGQANARNNPPEAEITTDEVELSYETSATVSDIVCKYKIPVTLAQASDFITVHPRPRHPRCVLEPCASLYCISEDTAFFVQVASDKIADVYSSGATPFMFDAQYLRAVRLISMPLSSFHRVARECRLGSAAAGQGENVIMLSNTTRCGSMLLCELLAAAPNTLCLREPDALTCCLFAPKEKTRALLASAIQLLCKDAGDDMKVVIKPRGHCTKLLRDLR